MLDLQHSHACFRSTEFFLEHAWTCAEMCGRRSWQTTWNWQIQELDPSTQQHLTCRPRRSGHIHLSTKDAITDPRTSQAWLLDLIYIHIASSGKAILTSRTPLDHKGAEEVRELTGCLLTDMQVKNPAKPCPSLCRERIQTREDVVRISIHSDGVIDTQTLYSAIAGANR